jgi:DNA-directed RNA polymerase specialized sigma24 family protein
MVYSTALDVIARRTPGLSLEDVSSSSGPAGPPVRAAPTGRRHPPLSYLDNLTPELLYEIKELRDHVIKAIDSLPRRRKSVLLLHIQGMNLEEIAAFLGETKPAVRHLLYRGIDGLRETISLVFPDRVPSRRYRAPNHPASPPES